MGLFKRASEKADEVYEAVEDAGINLLRDRRFERAEELASSGERNEAVITGIRRRTNEEHVDTVVRLEWFAPEPRVGAVLYGGDLPAGVRLGATVRVGTRGNEVAIDPAAMSGSPWAPSDEGRRSRKVPDQGIDEKALNWNVLSRIKKWEPQTATVTAHERVTLMGVPTQNWDITVQLADGSHALIKRDEVPHYARWYVAPGEEIPVVVNPKSAGEAQGNWPLLAEQRAARGGRWQEAPPPGSIAEDLHTGAGSTPSTAAIMGDLMGAPEQTDVPTEADPGAWMDEVEGVTVRRYAQIEAALAHGRVPPGEHDAVAARDFGVAPGRWGAIKSEWQARTMKDWTVGAAFGEAYEAATKELKKR